MLSLKHNLLFLWNNTFSDIVWNIHQHLIQTFQHGHSWHSLSCRHCPYVLEAIIALAELGVPAKDIISLFPQVETFFFFFLHTWAALCFLKFVASKIIFVLIEDMVKIFALYYCQLYYHSKPLMTWPLVGFFPPKDLPSLIDTTIKTKKERQFIISLMK